MNKLAILTPAIIDIECIKASQASLINNIILKNQNFKFEHYVHLDNHLRKSPRYKGTREEIHSFYESSIQNYDNLDLTLILPSTRVGLIRAAYCLFEQFLASQCEYCFIFEDDTTLSRSIPLDEVFEIIGDKDQDIVHFSFAVDANENLSGSVEKVFISGIPTVFKSFEYYERTYKEKSGMTWNGTFFHRNMIQKLLNHYEKDVYHEKFYPEDQISKFLLEKIPDAKIKTLFFSSEIEDLRKYEWDGGSIPRNKHIIFDEIRWAGGRSRALW